MGMRSIDDRIQQIILEQDWTYEIHEIVSGQKAFSISEIRC